MSKAPLRIALVILLAGILVNAWQRWPSDPPDWSATDIAVLSSLSLQALPPLPPDPGNRVADNPVAAQFGRQLFFDARLSDNGGISCATCHQPLRRFADGLPKGQALGTADRNTPSLVGAAYSPWQYWDGRRDSLWSQALVPLEAPNEHGFDRARVINLLNKDPDYREMYESLFGALPEPQGADLLSINTVFANVGKSIAAFERTIMPTESRFDAYVGAVKNNDIEASAALFSVDEVWGLRLFIGEANCIQCHNGPLLSNHEFHNTGVISFPGEVPDKGRIAGVREVLANEFNCLGRYSDDREHRCAELEFVRKGPELIGAFKTPSLRNLENTAPFMHKGQLPTLTAVLRHYNDAPDAMIGHNEAKPLGLTKRQLQQLEAFLLTLAAPVTSLSTETQQGLLTLVSQNETPGVLPGR